MLIKLLLWIKYYSKPFDLIPLVVILVREPPGKLMSLFLKWTISEDKSVDESDQPVAPAGHWAAQEPVFEYQEPLRLESKPREGE